MKTSLFSLVAVGVMSVLLAAGLPSVSKTVNVHTSKVNWKGYKVTGSHEGYVPLKSGTLEFDNSKLVGGEIVVNMASLTATDLSGGGKDKLEGHLKSDDFFGTDKYPTATIKLKKVASRGKEGEYKITGDLTIKGKTKEVKFDALVQSNKATASIKIDRTDFDVKYGSGSFFDNLGDKTIYDEFDLNIELNF